MEFSCQWNLDYLQILESQNDFPTNKYMFKVNKKTVDKEVIYVRSCQ